MECTLICFLIYSYSQLVCVILFWFVFVVWLKYNENKLNNNRKHNILDFVVIFFMLRA